MELGALIRHARGDAPADLLLKNAAVVNVLTGEILPSHVAIVRSRNVGLGDYRANEVVDLKGAYLAPGFIDAHVHVESAMVPPSEFARAVVPHGTTTVVTDPHEIANVLGLDGIRFMFESAKYGPLSMFVMASSCVPATARRVTELRGGMAAASGGQVMAEVPLPLAGLMSAEPVETVRRQVDGVLRAAHDFGSSLHDPFMAMSFLALEVIPSLKLTDQGLVDVERFAFVPLWVD